MKKTTVIFSVLVDEDKYYIQNIGFPTLYTFLKKQGITREIPEGIDNNEILLILDKAAKPGVMIEYVGDITNNYNRDQQQINKIKENIKNDRNYLRTRTEIQHIFNKNDIIIDAEKYNHCLDTHTYLDTLYENIEDAEKELSELKNKYIKLKSDLKQEWNDYKRQIDVKKQEVENEYQELLSDLEQEYADYKRQIDAKKQEVENEFKDLLNDIRQGDNHKKEIEDKINKLIEEKNKYQKEVDVLLQRYYKGTETIKDLDIQIREKRICNSNLTEEIQSLEEDVNDKKKFLADYESKVNELKSLDTILNERVKSNKDIVKEHVLNISEMENVINKYNNEVEKKLEMEYELESWNKLCNDFGLDRISMISKIRYLLS